MPTPSPKYPILQVDWVVVLLYLVLLVCGWFSICGATHELGDTNFFDWEVRTGKQLVWIACALTLAFVILMTHDKYYDTLAGLFYWGMVAVLVVTPFVAKDIKGSHSWVSLGFCNVQPAEFAKCATALAVAKLPDGYPVPHQGGATLLAELPTGPAGQGLPRRRGHVVEAAEGLVDASLRHPVKLTLNWDCSAPS